jgi:hypothetical protein
MAEKESGFSARHAENDSLKEDCRPIKLTRYQPLVFNSREAFVRMVRI